MDTHMISRASYLDLIFDGRNKQYGAYLLRTDYPRRMRRAAYTLLCLSALLLASLLFPESRQEIPMPVSTPLVETFTYQEFNVQPEKQVLPSCGGGSPARTEALAKPEIVEDLHADPNKNMAEQDALVKATAGTVHAEGTGTVVAGSSGSGSGTDSVGSEGTAALAGGTEKEFTVAEVNPEFPGGEAALMRYLAAEIRFPEQARNAHQQGRVVARFLVDKDGTIETVVIKRGFGFGSEEETIRVLRKMPRWQPGTVNGRPVRCWMQLPVQFMLE